MPTTVEIESEPHGKKVSAACVVEEPTKPGATKKGLKVFGYTWLGAVVTLFIPIVHFVTVPAALLLGPLLGYLTYRNALSRATISCPTATCPACRAPLPLTFASDVTEIERSCKACRALLKIRTSAVVSS